MMSRKVPSKAERYFSTGISMITSRGPRGPNVMAAEWVMQISYSPVLVAIFINKGSHKIKNIEKTKEFGVNGESKEQTTEIRKEVLGDHVMLVGRVVHIEHDDTKTPLIYHRGRYFSLGSTVEPDRQEVPVSKDTLEFFKNLAQEKFVLKCVGTLVEHENKILVTKWPKTKFETIPFVLQPQGENLRDHLVKHLKAIQLHITLEKEPIMRRLVLKNGMDIQRINFVLFQGKIKKPIKEQIWKSKNDEIISNVV